MDDLARLTVDEFLDRVAQRIPSPGGGSVAAAGGALAAALGRMVLAYSLPKDPDSPARRQTGEYLERMGRTDDILRALITRDAAAYDAMTAQRPRRGQVATEAYTQAVLAALAVPLEVAAAAADVLNTLDSCKPNVNKFLLSDLGAACVLAEAAARAASFMVAVNVPELPDADLRARLLGDVDSIVGRCRDARTSIESFVRREENGPPGDTGPAAGRAQK